MSTPARESLILHLRPCRVSPWSTDDHIAVLDRALDQLPAAERGQVLVRTDSGGCSKAFLHHITDAGLEHSIGFLAHETVKAAIEAIPVQAWRSAVGGDGEARDGAQVAELTGWMPTPTKGHPSRPEGLARRDAAHRPS